MGDEMVRGGSSESSSLSHRLCFLREQRHSRSNLKGTRGKKTPDAECSESNRSSFSASNSPMMRRIFWGESGAAIYPVSGPLELPLANSRTENRTVNYEPQHAKGIVKRGVTVIKEVVRNEAAVMQDSEPSTKQPGYQSNCSVTDNMIDVPNVENVTNNMITLSITTTSRKITVPQRASISSPAYIPGPVADDPLDSAAKELSEANAMVPFALSCHLNVVADFAGLEVPQSIATRVDGVTDLSTRGPPPPYSQCSSNFTVHQSARPPREVSSEQLKAITNGYSHSNYRQADQLWTGRLEGEAVYVALVNVTASQVDILSRVHHPNVMKLLGYRLDKFQGAMVTTSICNRPTNRTLSYYLSKNNPKPLDWALRSKIALHVAQGLNYLHSESYVVHGNLNTTIILLTHNFIPVIGGLNFTRQMAKCDFITDKRSSDKSARGYLAPEYSIDGGKHTEKEDVYAYGVILLELFTGRPAFNRTTRVSLDEWARSRMDAHIQSGKSSLVAALVDPEHVKHDSNNSNYYNMLMVAKMCIHNDPRERPSMAKVLETLPTGQLPDSQAEDERLSDPSKRKQKGPREADHGKSAIMIAESLKTLREVTIPRSEYHHLGYSQPNFCGASTSWTGPVRRERVYKESPQKKDPSRRVRFLGITRNRSKHSLLSYNDVE